MPNQPIRIAQMMTDMNYGGVEMVVMNYYRHIDRSRFQFDFYALEGSEIPQLDEIKQLGGRVFVVPQYIHLWDYEKTLIKYFKENKYDIVHSHMNALSVFSLRAAKIAGVKNRIAHSHSTAAQGEIKKNIVKNMLRPFSKIYPTKLIACSDLSGKWLYGKNTSFEILNNAIELDRFVYNEETRNIVRKELRVENKFIVGHIGRFCYQKNHELLINIFSEVYKKRKDAVLLLIGDGETKNQFKEQVHRLGLNDCVIILGNRNDTNRIYQAMDVFVLPSRYEGLPVVGIEAQASGIPLVMSDKVTKETKILESARFVPLDVSAKKWSEIILQVSTKYKRTDTREEMRKAGFEINASAKKLMKLYDELI